MEFGSRGRSSATDPHLPDNPETGSAPATRYRERALKVLPGGLGRSTFLVDESPPYVRGGHGYRVEDEHGNQLIDLNNNFTTLVHGHSEPLTTQRAVEAIRQGASFGSPNLYELEHAELLLERLPDADLIRYTNSGTEAVMIALRIARAHTGRDRCLIVRHAYHGTSDPVLPAGGRRSARGVPRSTRDDTVLLPLNDLEALEEAVACERGRVAAIMIDLLPNRAGLIAADPGYAARVEQLCREHGILLICDEVISFRLHYNGLSQTYGITPDLTVLGKLIGGGLPVGAVAGRREIMLELDPHRPDALEHGGTFSANPVTMAAGHATLTKLTRDEIERINRLGDSLRQALESSLDGLGWDVRGQGSLLRPFPRHREAPAAHRALWWEGYRRGLLLNPSGQIAISTAMDRELVDSLAGTLTEAVAAL